MMVSLLSWPSIVARNVSRDVKSASSEDGPHPEGEEGEPCRTIGAYSSNTMYLSSGRQRGLAAEDKTVHASWSSKYQV